MVRVAAVWVRLGCVLAVACSWVSACGGSASRIDGSKTPDQIERLRRALPALNLGPGDLAEAQGRSPIWTVLTLAQYAGAGEAGAEFSSLSAADQVIEVYQATYSPGSLNDRRGVNSVVFLLPTSEQAAGFLKGLSEFYESAGIEMHPWGALPDGVESGYVGDAGGTSRDLRLVLAVSRQVVLFYADSNAARGSDETTPTEAAAKIIKRLAQAQD